MTEFKILTAEELETALKNLLDWRAENNQLKAEFIFKDFKQAFAFMALIALQAEKLDHHPEWSNVYNKVNFVFFTHDAGNKITDSDIAMATFVSESAKDFLR